jgi:hypothetical protein
VRYARNSFQSSRRPKDSGTTTGSIPVNVRAPRRHLQRQSWRGRIGSPGRWTTSALPSRTCPTVMRVQFALSRTLAKCHIPHKELEHGENDNREKRDSNMLVVPSEFLHPQRSAPAVISTSHGFCDDGSDWHCFPLAPTCGRTFYDQLVPSCASGSSGVVFASANRRFVSQA